MPRIPYVDESVIGRDFKYYIFDWDDNILRMPTRIHMEKRREDGTWEPISVSTTVFSVIRTDTLNYRLSENDRERAFAEFRDDPQTGSDRFLRDTAVALERALSGCEPSPPSFHVFRQTLVEGRLFAIVTARGHSEDTLKKGVRMFIDRVLSDEEKLRMLGSLRGYRQCFDKLTTFGSDEDELAYYLSLCHYHAVESPSFKARVGDFAGKSEISKQFAIRDFVEYVIRMLHKTGADALSRPISVGFSDDDPKNVKAIEEYIRCVLAQHFPSIKFCVYDTSDQHGVRKIVVAGQLDLF